MNALLAKWLAAGAAVALLVLGYVWWSHQVEARGYAAAEAIYKKREADITAQAKDEYTKKLEHALGKQQALQQEVDTQTASRAAWEKAHETAAQKRIDAANAGTERLRIQIARAASAVPGVAQSGAAGAAGDPGQTEGADLMPGTAAAILSLARDGAGLVRDYNDLLARYRTIEAACK